jgi:glycosyltransferase involved in cell wall biosynthesis
VKVLLVIRSLTTGGAQRQVVTLAKSLSAAGHTIHVAVFESGGAIENELVDTNAVTMHVLNRRKSFGPVGLLYIAWQLRRLSKKYQYDAVYGFLPIPNLTLLGTRMMSNRPKIVWGVRSSNLNLDEYRERVKWSIWIEKIASRWADSIISNSFAARTEYVGRGYPSNKFDAIHNAIDIDRFSPNKTIVPELTAELGIPEASAVIGIFARIHPKKDHKTFLDAAAITIASHPETHFLAAGGYAVEDGTLMQNLQERVVELGISNNIHWLGERQDPERLMNACTITTLTSSSGEGFPNSIAESAACGVPCVATDSGDAREIITDERFVVSPSDPKALADAWKLLLLMPRDELETYGRQLRSSIVVRFSASVITDQLVSVLKK